jgi:hypothetical protein
MDEKFERLWARLALWEVELTTRLGTRLSAVPTIDEKFFQLGMLLDLKSDKVVARLERISESLGAVDLPAMILVYPKTNSFRSA